MQMQQWSTDAIDADPTMVKCRCNIVADIKHNINKQNIKRNKTVVF